MADEAVTSEGTDRDVTYTATSQSAATPTRRTSDGAPAPPLDVDNLTKTPGSASSPGRGPGAADRALDDGEFDESIEDENETWVADLPAVVRPIVRAFYVPMLDDDNDDATQRFRKGLVTVTLLAVPAAILLIVGNYVSDAGSPEWNAAKALAVCGPVPLFALPLLYARVRARKRASEAVANLFNAVVIGFYLLMTISTPDIGWQPSWLQCGIVVLLSRTRFASVWWIVTALGMLLAIWNDATVSAGSPELSATVPGSNETRKLVTQLVFAVPFGLFAYVYFGILQQQLTAAEDLANQSRVSTAVAQLLAEFLNSYDTQRANTLIETQREAAERGERMVCQPVLLDAFEQLVDNLGAYRPHIPNWLLPNANAVEDQGGEKNGARRRSRATADAFDAFVASGNSVAMLFQINARANKDAARRARLQAQYAASDDEEDADMASLGSMQPTEDSPGRGDIDLAPGANDSFSAPASASASNSRRNTASFSATRSGELVMESVTPKHQGDAHGSVKLESLSGSPAASFAVSPPKALQSANQASSGGGSTGSGGNSALVVGSPQMSVRSPMRRGTAASTRLGVPGALVKSTLRSPAAKGRSGLAALTVVVAQVAFEIADKEKLPRSAVADATDAIVDRIFALANQLGAAAHSFVGDVVTLSWNAANRVMQPESKAAKFLLRLRQDPGHDLAVVGGAAFAAIAHVGTCGGRTGGQRAVTIHSPWWPVFQRLFELGRHHATFVVNNTMRSQLEYAAKTRGVGGLEAVDWRRHPGLRRVGAGAAAAAAAEDDAGTEAPASPIAGRDPTAFRSPSILLGARQDAAVSSGNAGAGGKHAAAATVPSPGLDGECGVAGRPPPPHMTRVGVFELLTEVTDGGDGEWMYLLQEQGAGSRSGAGQPSSPHSAGHKGVTTALTKAVDAWMADRDDAAIAALETVSASVLPPVALDGLAAIPALRQVLEAESSGLALPGGAMAPAGSAAWSVIGAT